MQNGYFRQNITTRSALTSVAVGYWAKRMPNEAFNCRQTWADLLLILPRFTEINFYVYTIKKFTSVKLNQN